MATKSASRFVTALPIAAGMMVPGAVSPTAPGTPTAASADFYRPPTPLPAGGPGDPIRSAPGHLTVSSRQFTDSGASIADELSANPVTRAVVDGLRLGTRPPADPVLVSIGSNDDVVPPAPVEDPVDGWRAQRADVTLMSDPAPLALPGTGLAHATYSPFAIFTRGLQWIEQRFARAASATG